jgi:hypothetical protein
MVNSVSEGFGRGVYMWVYDNVKRKLADDGGAGDVNVSNLSLGKVCRGKACCQSPCIR